MDSVNGWLVLVLVVAGIGWFYVKDRIPPVRHRGPDKVFQPTQQPQPQGPMAPAGLPMPPTGAPPGARPPAKIGPQYLTGKIRELSELSLAHIHEEAEVEGLIATLKQKYPDIANYPLAEMAADFLGALRWWSVSIAPKFDDELRYAGLRDNPQQFVARCIDAYGKQVFGSWNRRRGSLGHQSVG